jgi:ankyrin repeat protein
LHWSCYSGSEIASSYLLAYTKTADLNLQDSEGLTPLHLAVKTGLSNNSTRIIRHLLLKGASRNIKVVLNNKKKSVF